MRKCSLPIIVAVFGALLAPSGHAQVCGDVNGDGDINVLDIVMCVNYLAWGPTGNEILANMDCDGRTGVTVSDAMRMVDNLFRSGDPIDGCNPTQTYTFATSVEDTVFIPYLSSIPADLNTIELPLLTSFAPDTRAFYGLIQVREINGPGLFAHNAVSTPPSSNILVSWFLDADTVVFEGAEIMPGDFAGRREFFTYKYTRQAPGVASLASYAADRNSLLRICIEKGGDLYLPVLQYYEPPIPLPYVNVDPTAVQMTTLAGQEDFDTYDITFTSELRTISFNLEVSDPWITIENFSPGGYTTPATITVRGDATNLGIGDYTGQIVITNPVPEDAAFSSDVIDISLHATDPGSYPFGDLNCDGIVSIGDISVLIDYLFISQEPIPPCE
jgi:hypothetical protein